MAENGETIRLEFMPWIARKLGFDDSRWRTMEEEWGEDLTARGLLERLRERYPEFGDATYDGERGKLTGQVSIVINGQFLEVSGGLDRALDPGDVIVFLPAFAGGRL
jgi:molybdopterin converting factor small subunit